MKKLLQAISMLILSVALLAVGIYAAVTNVSLTSSAGSFHFYTDAAFVKIEGFVNYDEKPHYTGITYDAVTNYPKNADTWDLATYDVFPDGGGYNCLKLDRDNFTLTLEFVFTNKTDAKVTYKFTKPTATSTYITVSGGFQSGTAGTVTGTVNSDQAVSTKINDVVKFKYVFSLINFNNPASLDLTGFKVEMLGNKSA